MVGILVSFWGPPYFQVRTVRFREGNSLVYPTGGEQSNNGCNVTWEWSNWKIGLILSRWWFQICVLSPLTTWKWSKLTTIFEMDWNGLKQPSSCWWKKLAGCLPSTVGGSWRAQDVRTAWGKRGGFCRHIFQGSRYIPNISCLDV